MASLLDEWATVRASDTGDARALSPGVSLGVGGAGGVGPSAAIGFMSDSDDAPDGAAAPGQASFLGMPAPPAEPDIFALDPVEREVTR